MRFVRPEGIEAALGRSREVTWLDEDGVAQRLRELREDSTSWLGETCLDAARRAGLIVSRARIERFAEIGAIVVERYDRRMLGDRIRRVHQEDLCQALGLPPDRKYQRNSCPTPGRIARLLRNAMPPSVADLLGDREDPEAVARVVVDALKKKNEWAGHFPAEHARRSGALGLRRGDRLATLRYLLNLAQAPEAARWLTEAQTKSVELPAP